MRPHVVTALKAEAAEQLRTISAALALLPPTVVQTEATQVDAAWLLAHIAAHLSAAPRRTIFLEENASELI
jgi:hypothetical protein